VLLDGKPVPYYGISIDEDPSSTFARPTPVRDAAGRFTQHDVAPGTFAVIIVGPGFARRVVAGVRVVSGRVTDVGDIAVVRGGRVHGRVVDPNGAGVAGATVRITTSPFSSEQPVLHALMRGELSATSDASGNYEVVGLGGAPDEYRPDERRIEAQHPTYGRSGYRLLAAGETDVDLVLRATGSIDGTLVRPRAGIHLVAASRAEDRHARYYADVTAAGTFRFPQLPPGAYDVDVLGPNGQPAAHATVTAGAHTVVVFEFPANPVELHVHVAAGCSLVSLTTVAGEMVRLESCTEGRATFPDLAPGPYQLCLELSECRPIDVPATAVHAIELAR